MSYDVAVIGSGPGGYTAAFRAGQYGLKTALIEKDPKLGGTCLHVGCIPTKALLHTAEVWDYLKNPGEQGLYCENPRLDLPAVLTRKQKIVDKHASGITMLAKKNKVDVLAGYGTLLGNGKIQVKSATGEKIVEAKNIILATGSGARMIPGLTPDSTILTNVEILDMPAVPKTLAIIGAGAVGVEFASIFARFGTKVTVLEMLPRLVPVEDEDVSKELARSFKKAGIRCETGAKVENVEKFEGGVRLTVTLDNKKTEIIEAEKLLVAVGRKPITDAVGLEKTRVESDRGFIKVNQFQQTAEPGVYAIGDIVAGTPQLAHVASMEGLIAVGHIAGKSVRPINKNRIPGATYIEARAADVEGGESVDDHLFETADVGDHVALPFAEVDDGIADDLAGPMIGDIAAAVGGMQLDAGSVEQFLRSEDIFAMRVAAEGNYVRMFEDEELVRNQALLALVHETLLQLIGRLKTDAAQIAELAITH